MINLKDNWGKIFVFLLLLAGSLVTMYIQIDKAQTASKLESTLISAIQFFLSIGFTWFLSQAVFESSQKEKIKKFAITAFRRIKEIERNVKRTHEYISESIKFEDDPLGCLRIVHANLINAQDTINSSMSDWADIIEDEIELGQEIEKLEYQQNQLLHGKTLVVEEQGKIEQRIVDLSKRLPPTLRYTFKVGKGDDIQKKKAVDYLNEEISSKGCLNLRAFWEPNDGLMKEPNELKVGDEVYIARGLTDTRIPVVMVFDKDGNSIGIVVNRCRDKDSGYDIFANAMDIVFGRKIRPKLLGGKPILAKVVEVEEIDKISKRKYFTMITEENPTSPRDQKV